MIGTTVGNYRIVERLGDGGMGTVYRAVDEMLDRDVAIKVLKPELARQSALIERFRQEAIALARLNHPRIATLHGLERQGENLLMIMEYVRGETLEAIVHRSGRLAWPRAVELCIGILDALDHAHDKGVVHRDIKPANVMLTHAGALKVMDFGIARVIGKNRQTRVGHAVGTPMYMSPEQLRGEEVDGRSDLYSVGSLLFELLTGRMAFEADSDYSLMMMQLNDPPPAPGSLVADIPPALDAIVLMSMAKTREGRFANAIAFRDALAQLLAETPTATRRAAPPPTRLGDSAASAPSAAPAGPAAGGVAPTPIATPIAAAPPGAIAETRLAGPPPIAETRLAPDSAALPATRLVAAQGIPQTRLDTSAAGRPHWSRDWRVWSAAAGVLVVAGLGVRALRAPGDGRSMADTAALAANTQTRIVPGSLGDTSGQARRVAPDPAAPVGGSRIDLPPQRSVVDSAAPPSPKRPPPPAGGRGVSLPATPADSAARSGEDPARKAEPPAEKKPDPPPPPHEESSEEAIASVQIALSEFSSQVGEKNVGRVDGVLHADDNTRSQWLSLMREGRLSMAVQGVPAVQLQGSSATAEFSAALNVRSPFGAVKRRNGQFVAELSRAGGRWQVTSVRLNGAVDLK